MKASKRGIDLIKKFEGLHLNAYLCPAKVPTIGYGSIMWPDGRKVKLGETITIETAEKLLAWEIEQKTKAIPPITGLNQNQQDALISFAYNLGIGALMRSTLWKKVKANPNDSTIHNEFMKWINVRQGSKLVPLKGLIRRREAESALYFEKMP